MRRVGFSSQHHRGLAPAGLITWRVLRSPCRTPVCCHVVRRRDLWCPPRPPKPARMHPLHGGTASDSHLPVSDESLMSQRITYSTTVCRHAPRTRQPNLSHRGIQFRASGHRIRRLTGIWSHHSPRKLLHLPGRPKFGSTTPVYASRPMESRVTTRTSETLNLADMAHPVAMRIVGKTESFVDGNPVPASRTRRRQSGFSTPH